MKWGPVLALMCLTLSGCLTAITGADGTRKGGPENEALYYSVGEVGGAGKRLIPYTTLTGYMTAAGSGTSASMRLLAGLGERIAPSRHPVAIAAGEGGVYVLDGRSQSLYRFRWHADGVENSTGANGGLSKPDYVRLRMLTELEEANDVFVAPDGDVFITDGKGHKVVRYDADGRPKMEFTDAENLNHPVSVAVDSRGLRIFVADGLFDRVVVFNPQAVSLYGIGFRGDGPGGFKNIRGMVQGRNGLLYVVNGVRQQVQAYGLDGTYMGAFGQGTFSDPDGITVDDDNRVYISDRFNHRILIFADGKLVEMFGRHGTKAGEFSQPGRLTYYKGLLYVVDRENNRVQVFKVVPEKFLASGGR
ncbi:MAG: NHL repeat-containing protein [Rhodospirillaceae bacterium]|nr:NHL repeat-containing protein [Rhodospirillales bacterium]